MEILFKDEAFVFILDKENKVILSVSKSALLEYMDTPNGQIELGAVFTGEDISAYSSASYYGLRVWRAILENAVGSLDISE